MASGSGFGSKYSEYSSAVSGSSVCATGEASSVSVLVACLADPSSGLGPLPLNGAVTNPSRPGMVLGPD